MNFTGNPKLYNNMEELYGGAIWRSYIAISLAWFTKKNQSCNGRGAKGVEERDKGWASVLLVPFHNATCAWLNKTLIRYEKVLFEVPKAITNKMDSETYRKN